jgi:hypothetical protein
LKITYKRWWQVFYHEYKVKTHDEVKESGIYYNEGNDSFEAHFKPDERTDTKVVTRIEMKVLEESDSKLASRLVKELAGQLVKHYISKAFDKGSKLKLDIPQFEKLHEVLS